MAIGTIVKSNSHVSYMCRVYGKLETDSLPEPESYSFGTFVTLNASGGEEVHLVGVIRDTFLINPDYGNLGPRLSSDADLAVFSPDYLNEKGVLLDILILGWIENGRPHHGVPAPGPQVGAVVNLMPEGLVQDFHRGPTGRFSMGYLPQVISRNDPMMATLMINILDKLEPAFPEERGVIGVLRNNLAWKATVVPAG